AISPISPTAEFQSSIPGTNSTSSRAIRICRQRRWPRPERRLRLSPLSKQQDRRHLHRRRFHLLHDRAEQCVLESGTCKFEAIYKGNRGLGVALTAEDNAWLRTVFLP